MEQNVKEFLLKLETAVLNRVYLSSKREMLGTTNRELERFKTSVAVILLTFVEGYYTNTVGENYATDEEILTFVDTINYICDSSIYLTIPTTYSTVFYHFWNDAEYWDDARLWLD